MDSHTPAPESETDTCPPEWRTSSYSGSTGGQCVEVALPRPGSSSPCLVRDSKGREGPALAFSQQEWRSFAADVKAGKHSLS